MRFTPALLLTVFLTACNMLPIPGLSGGSSAQSTKTETSSSSTTEEVNGRPVDLDDDGSRDDDEDRPRSKKKSSRKDDDENDIGKTCHKNNECAAAACFVGSGDLGYCTKMCSSWSECPTHWECKRAGNAPQKICMQDS